MGRTVLYGTLALSLLALAHAHGNLEGAESTTLDPETVAKYFTEQQILPEGHAPSGCPARVLEKRAELKAKGGITLGVVPTVSLSMAMLIFILVGVFAAGIAQAFQMVSGQKCVPIIFLY